MKIPRFNFNFFTNKVFKPFPAMLGGRCRFFVSGSAPLSSDDGEFVAICFNMNLFEGFGMSETAAHGCV